MKKILMLLILLYVNHNAQLLLLHSEESGEVSFDIDLNQIAVDGGFDTGAAWITSTWVIANSVATIDGGGIYVDLYQTTSGLDTNRLFLLCFEVVERNSGILTPILNNQALGYITTTGKKFYNVIPSASTAPTYQQLRFNSWSPEFNGSIDDVRLYQSYWNAGDVNVGSTVYDTLNITESNSGWAAELTNGSTDFSITVGSNTVITSYSPSGVGADADSIKFTVNETITNYPSTFYYALDGVGTTP